MKIDKNRKIKEQWAIYRDPNGTVVTGKMRKEKMNIENDNLVELEIYDEDDVRFTKKVIINIAQIITLKNVVEIKRWSLENNSYIVVPSKYIVEILGFIPVINNEIGIMYFEYLDKKNNSFMEFSVTENSYKQIIKVINCD